MTIRFSLPESLEEFDEQEESLEQPCFPYHGYEERPGGINFWVSVTAKRLIQLNLKINRKGLDTLPAQQPVPGNVRHSGRKILLQVTREEVVRFDRLD
ncbi:hypothetical protein [Endozoicomonas lisbonensis]|uniref:Uncharacterized protein n=1 Tax=Endozoicomonas lisbonensis TaxID=3120522 RepID=A0ABV2SK20_9GAMM